MTTKILFSIFMIGCLISILGYSAKEPEEDAASKTAEISIEDNDTRMMPTESPIPWLRSNDDPKLRPNDRSSNDRRD